MDARSRRKCFAERSFSHDIVLRSNAFQTENTSSPPRPKDHLFAATESKPPISRSAHFCGKLSRTDSSIIVISQCSGNSATPTPKPNAPKKKLKAVRQNSLSSFIQKHLGHFNYQRQSPEKQTSKSLGVPATNVAGTSSTSQRKHNNSISHKGRPADGGNGRQTSPLTSPNLLGVPNIFTTAFSRSHRSAAGADVSPEDIRLTEQADSEGGIISKGYSKSTPELQDSAVENTRERRPSDDVSQQMTSLLQSNKYKDSHVCEILDYLYMGSIEAAYHEPLLCKLGIDSLIDISNIPPEKVPYHKKSDCPCMCISRTRHLRAKLYVAVEDDPTENIEQYFAEINSFIEGVRRCGKRVLIYSYHGNSRAPTAVIQHLMKQKNLLLRQSFNLVKNQRPSIKLNPGFRATLEDLERKLFPKAKPSVSFENEFVNVTNPQLVKTAWADC